MYPFPIPNKKSFYIADFICTQSCFKSWELKWSISATIPTLTIQWQRGCIKKQKTNVKKCTNNMQREQTAVSNRQAKFFYNAKHCILEKTRLGQSLQPAFFAAQARSLGFNSWPSSFFIRLENFYSYNFFFKSICMNEMIKISTMFLQ